MGVEVAAVLQHRTEQVQRRPEYHLPFHIYNASRMIFTTLSVLPIV